MFMAIGVNWRLFNGDLESSPKHEIDTPKMMTQTMYLITMVNYLVYV